MRAAAVRALLPIALALGLAAGPRLPFRLNLSPSLPRGLYLVTGTSPRAGELAMACLPADTAAVGLERGYLRAGDCPGGAAPVLKWIAAGAGSQVLVGAEGVSVDGRQLRSSRRRAVDSQGRALATVPLPSEPLPPATVWLHAPKAESWDSRYYGSVSAESVLATLRPLVTFPPAGSTAPSE